MLSYFVPWLSFIFLFSNSKNNSTEKLLQCKTYTIAYHLLRYVIVIYQPYFSTTAPSLPVDNLKRIMSKFLLSHTDGQIQAVLD